MELTRRTWLQGLGGLGALALPVLGPALRRALAALGTLAVRAEPVAAHDAIPVLGRGAGEGGLASTLAGPAVPLLPAQWRAARRLLGWSEEETARASGLSRAALRALEREAAGGESQRERDDGTGAAARLRRTFEGAGIVFIGSPSDRRGVGLAPRPGAGEGIR
jgi:hypothetical protein